MEPTFLDSPQFTGLCCTILRDKNEELSDIALNSTVCTVTTAAQQLQNVNCVNSMNSFLLNFEIISQLWRICLRFICMTPFDATEKYWKKNYCDEDGAELTIYNFWNQNHSDNVYNLRGSYGVLRKCESFYQPFISTNSKTYPSG